MDPDIASGGPGHLADDLGVLSHKDWNIQQKTQKNRGEIASTIGLKINSKKT